MSRWYEGPLCGFDLETTSPDPMTARIVTAAVVSVGLKPSFAGEKAEGKSWIVAVDVEIPEEAAKIHGFSTERARAEGRPLAEVLAQIVPCLRQGWERGGPVTPFNASFDLTILLLELERCGLPTMELGPVVDPFVIDKHVSYRKGSRKLADVAAFYGVKVEASHEAGADALTAMRVAWQIGKRFPSIGGSSLPALHASQVMWAAEQRESLEQHFTRIGRPQHVDRGWPVTDAFKARG